MPSKSCGRRLIHGSSASHLGSPFRARCEVTVQAQPSLYTLSLHKVKRIYIKPWFPCRAVFVLWNKSGILTARPLLFWTPSIIPSVHPSFQTSTLPRHTSFIPLRHTLHFLVLVVLQGTHTLSLARIAASTLNNNASIHSPHLINSLCQNSNHSVIANPSIFVLRTRRTV